LCGRHGEVTHLAEERAQSRQLFIGKPNVVVEDLEGAQAQRRIAELEQRIADSGSACRTAAAAATGRGDHCGQAGGGCQRAQAKG